MEQAQKAFGELLNIMKRLRSDCPWDKKQTLESLRTLTVEETYELSDAIMNKNLTEIKKELGDMLMHIVFYTAIAEEQGAFNMEDVINTLNEKLIYRHPHVFSNTKVTDEKQVSENWEKLKLKEKGRKQTVLEGVPKSLPSIIKAERIQDKACGVGFDWEKPEQVWDKVEEELEEFKEELLKNPKSEDAEKELGDLIFSIINAARLYKINPDSALEKTNRKFIKRFNYLEEQTLKKGKDLHKMTLEEMEKIWQQAKQFD